LSRTSTTGRIGAGLWPVAAPDRVEERHEVGAALGAGGVHQHLTAHGLLGSQHRHLLGLPRRLNPQIGTALGPGMGKIRVGERLRLVGK
jgi:hypothetical protein